MTLTDATAGPEEPTGTERAVLGPAPGAELRAFLDSYTLDRLGSPIAEVRFRAGRIDAVWGVVLGDGRPVVVKAHRQPVDVVALRAARDAQSILAAAGYPCPRPLSGPDEVDGRVLTAEVLLADGAAPDGRDPAHRRLLADGLVAHIDVLRGHPDLLGRAGVGPSWCRYHDGPWPVPHDPIVDFRSTTVGYGWLDTFARQASGQVIAHRDPDGQVVAHADWYGGNTAVAGGELVGTFDWELVADDEAVVAGFAAACYAASATSGAGLSTPEDAVAFLRDYDRARGEAFTRRQQRAAAGATAWILAFNARWEIGMPSGEGATTSLVRERHADFLDLSW
jgi:hypothetical protein